MNNLSGSVKTLIGVVVVIIVGGALYFGMQEKQMPPAMNEEAPAMNQPAMNEPATNQPGAGVSSVEYKNEQYGFQIPLPDSWKGYTVVTSKWEGNPLVDGGVSATGPLVSVRHPEWTRKNPRQDIPVMVFTIDQWNALQRDDFHIGAAPIQPGELGRNAKYVFALPARYNYAFLAGYEEVTAILPGFQAIK